MDCSCFIEKVFVFFYYFCSRLDVQLVKKFYLCPTLNERKWQK